MSQINKDRYLCKFEDCRKPVDLIPGAPAVFRHRSRCLFHSPDVKSKRLEAGMLTAFDTESDMVVIAPDVDI